MARRGRKLRGAAKAAFLRRMARGRRRAGLRVNPGRRRRRGRARTRSTATRRRSAGGITGRMLALLPLGLGGRSMARRKRKRTRTGRRRRRNPGALLVNPRRKRRRSRRRRRNPVRRRRRNALLVNPRRRRRYGRRRRRNPGIAGFARQGMKDIVMAAIPATVGGVIIGLIDAKLLGPMGTVGRTVGKLLTAVLVAAIGRRWLGPMGTGVAMGAILGTIGHEVGIRLGGGVVAVTKKEGVQELVEMAATDAEVQAELGALIEGGIGDESTATAVSSYERAIMGNSPLPKEYEGVFDDEDES